MTAIYLNDLPNELIEKIFDSLPIDSFSQLKLLSQICRKWRRILLSEHFYKCLTSFEHISRHLLYRFPREDDEHDTMFRPYLQRENDQSRPVLVMADGRTTLRHFIQHCPLINLSITFWCRTFGHSAAIRRPAMLVIWHYHFGYLGVYTSKDERNPVIQCTYTQSYELISGDHGNLFDWTHIGIVIDESRGLQLFVDGDRVRSFPLKQATDNQTFSPVPHSAIWFGSNNGGDYWSGSLFDVAIWNRCLDPYEIRAMAKTRINLNDVDFLTELYQTLRRL